MGINKVVYGKRTIIDLTEDTVNEDVLLEGYTAHDAAGEKIEGRASVASGEYVKKSGDTMDGPLILKKGSYVHSAKDRAGTMGYLKIAEITITNVYPNEAIVLELSKRNVAGMTSTLYISFQSINSIKTKPNYFYYTGLDYDCYLSNGEGSVEASSTWFLYVKKGEGYDEINVIRANIGLYMQNRSDIKWIDEFVESPPQNSIKAVLGGNVKNSETVDGHTVKSDVPSDAKFTDTWRGIQNNLTSNSTTDSLSAAQGKVLDEKITKLNSKLDSSPTFGTNANLNVNLNAYTTDNRYQLPSDGFLYLSIVNDSSGWVYAYISDANKNGAIALGGGRTSITTFWSMLVKKGWHVHCNVSGGNVLFVPYT